MDDFPILSVLVALPLVGAFLVPSLKGAAAKQAGLVFALATLAVSVVVALSYELDGGMQLTETYDWIPSFGVHLQVPRAELIKAQLLLTPCQQFLAHRPDHLLNGIMKVAAVFRGIVESPQPLKLEIHVVLKAGVLCHLIPQGQHTVENGFHLFAVSQLATHRSYPR